MADGEPAPTLPGYEEPKRMVFCGLYPSDGQDFEQLREALEKLSINDPSFEFEPETSDALGFGFRCGFLGLLHMEIVQQRLEQDSDIDLVQTAPNVTYELTLNTGENARGPHAAESARPGRDRGDSPADRARELRAADRIHRPDHEALHRSPRRRTCGPSICRRRGRCSTYDLALADVVYDMHDKLKSSTRGYGTMDYELLGYQPGELVRMDILVKGDRIDALSIICDRRDAEVRGRAVIKKLKQEIPRHMFEVPLQAAIGTRIIARETISAMRKNVTAKCYGGDITRKRKLWEKQKEGKKRMKSIGQVDIPQKAFLAVLETGEEEGKKK